MKKIILGMSIVLVLSSVLFSQETVPAAARNHGAQYFLGSEDELLIPVNVWGFVQRPGQYMVPANTELVTLLSYAGGPTEDAKIDNIRIVRSDPKTGNTVFRINVKKFLQTADENLIPVLKPGDTVIVHGTTFHWISNFFEFISRLTVIAQIVYFIAIAQEYLGR